MSPQSAMGFTEADLSKVVFVKGSRKKQAANKGSVGEKRVRAPDGRIVRVMTVDAGSKTLGDDLQTVFRRSVRRAREENTKALGASGRVHAKG
jgi:hypothetical protein